MKQSKHQILALAAIAMLLITGSCTQKSNEKSVEQKVSIDSLHSEVQDTLNKISTQDSINESSDSEICRMYCQLMDSLKDTNLRLGHFFLYDITKDGIPELWAVDAHSVYGPVEVYQFVDHQARYIGGTCLDHSLFISSDEGLYQECGHMDVYDEKKYTFNGKEVVEKQTWKCHMTPEKWEKTGGEIPEPHHKNRKEIDFIEYKGHNDIRQALKNY